MIVVNALTVAACGLDSGETALPDTQSESPSLFGSPAEAEDADRVIEIQSKENMAFEPAEITVAPGETVTLRLSTTGAWSTTSPSATRRPQDEHETEVAEMGGMAHEEANVVTIRAGETVELTWTFGETGTSRSVAISL